MKKLNRKNIAFEDRLPIRVLQFGEGNFLRAFVDYAFQLLNKEAGFNAGIAVVQPIEKGKAAILNEQDGLFTLFSRGIRKGREIQEKTLITNIVQAINPYTNYNDYLLLAREDGLEFVISNTTEAGIAHLASDSADMRPPASFPAKLTLLLYERYTYFNGAPEKGVAIIPCELINHNAATLQKIILAYIEEWELDSGFTSWLLINCTFHNSLVDRIVPGYPADDIDAYSQQLGYEDRLLVTSEAFFLWVIEGDARLKKKLPFHKTRLNVQIVDSIQPFRTRKVRILNGAHTAMVPLSILYGHETVKEAVDDAFTGEFIRHSLFDEIIPTLDMDKKELEQFAEDVLDRFRNPFIKHYLSSIALNSISKFKVRVLPSILGYIALRNNLPCHLLFSFACLIRFYKGAWYGKQLPVNDEPAVVEEMTRIWQTGNFRAIAEQVLADQAFWGRELSTVPGLVEAMAMALDYIDDKGIEAGFMAFKNNLNLQHHAT